MSRITSVVLMSALAACWAMPAHAIFNNGGFEANSYTGWTLAGGTNPGLGGAPPFTSASVQISGTTPGPASIVTTASDLRAPGIVLPRVGTYTAKINDEATGALLTKLVQSDVVTAADIDPGDGKPHIRFAFAPVMDDPGHSPEQQPYFYVGVRKMSDNSILFEQFAYSGQPGVNFQQGTGSWKYLPFQDVDIPLSANAVGEQIELTVIASDCSLGGHGGYVYIDGFGSGRVGSSGSGTAAASLTPLPALDARGLFLLAGLLGWVGWRAARRTV
jgi:hypothetical protein